MDYEPIVLEYKVLTFDPGLVSAIFDAIKWFFGIGSEAGQVGTFTSTFAATWQVFSIVSFIVSALLLAGIIYSKLRLMHLAEVLEEQLHHEEEAWHHAHGSHENSRWEQVLEHASSDGPNDWRLAIIEADIMLDEALGTMGLIGQTIGEKLKMANPDTFRSLNDAWEAHKVRNEIAHRGGDFILTKRIAQETIQRYQRVFSEVGMI